MNLRIYNKCSEKKEFCDTCLLNLSPRPLHRRGSLCTVHFVETDNYPSLHPSPVERGRGRGLDDDYFSSLKNINYLNDAFC